MRRGHLQLMLRLQRVALIARWVTIKIPQSSNAFMGQSLCLTQTALVAAPVLASTEPYTIFLTSVVFLTVTAGSNTTSMLDHCVFMAVAQGRAEHGR